MRFITQPSLYSSSDIKREAKAQLAGNWKQAIILCVIPAIVSIFLVWNTSDGNGESSLIVDLTLGLFATGASYTLLDFLRNKNYVIRPFPDVFQAFRKEYLFKLFLLKLIINLYTFLWALLFIIPGIIKFYAYSQAEFIFKDIVDSTGEQPSIRECLYESEQLMKGEKLNLLALELSFFGWYIFSAFTLGLAYFWLNPYIQMSRVIFYENISESRYRGQMDNHETVDSERSNDENYEEVGIDPDDFRDFDDF